MTAEIVILNKIGVALAADSAVTVTGPMGKKISKSQNKLFMLSKYEPIGIMEYNSADFMGISWETIIKEYRGKLNKNYFDSLEGYVNDFFRFIQKRFAGSQKDQKEYFRQLVRNKFSIIKKTILLKDETFTMKEFQEFVEKFENNPDQFARFCIEKICRELRYISNLYWSGVPNEFVEEILTEYDDIIDTEIERLKSGVGKLPISEELHLYLKQIAVYSFYERATGLVITGFGKNEIFPSIYSFTIGGIVKNKLKRKQHEHETYKVDRDNPAFIIPFAQHEMVDTFLEGVSPSFQDKSEEYLEVEFKEYPNDIIKIFDAIEEEELEKNAKDFVIEKLKEIKDEKTKKIDDYRNAMSKVKRKYKIKILTTIINLPKDELALMAETMVHITSLKRKVTFDQDETVGGAIDVAVISKGDGFVWIKRKHYFKPELNHHFFKVYHEERPNFWVNYMNNLFD